MGTQPHPSVENWIKNLLSTALPIRTRLSFSLCQSLPAGSFHKPLILLHQRADRLKPTMEHYSAIKRNTFESVLMRWMTLEPIKQNEISQSEKDK